MQGRLVLGCQPKYPVSTNSATYSVTYRRVPLPPPSRARVGVGVWRLEESNAPVRRPPNPQPSLRLRVGRGLAGCDAQSQFAAPFRGDLAGKQVRAFAEPTATRVGQRHSADSRFRRVRPRRDRTASCRFDRIPAHSILRQFCHLSCCHDILHNLQSGSHPMQCDLAPATTANDVRGLTGINTITSRGPIRRTCPAGGYGLKLMQEAISQVLMTGKTEAAAIRPGSDVLIAVGDTHS